MGNYFYLDKEIKKITVECPQVGIRKEVHTLKETPIEIFKTFKEGVWNRTAPIVCKVNGVLWDLVRPLEEDCILEFTCFDDEEGKKVFWHSSAHVLGEACEQVFGCHLCSGPPTDSGFFYDIGGINE